MSKAFEIYCDYMEVPHPSFVDLPKRVKEAWLKIDKMDRLIRCTSCKKFKESYGMIQLESPKGKVITCACEECFNVFASRL